MLDPMVASAPEPVLAVDGYQGVISGVRMRHSGACLHCRTAVPLWTDNGLVLVGLYVSESRKTCRWYEEERPAARPVPGPECPECGKASEPGRWWAPLTSWGKQQSISSTGSTIPLCNRVYEHMRAAYPDEAAAADLADRQGRPRPRAPHPDPSLIRLASAN